ncbi:MAG: secondary thiamine-phosphate synthase enzyme YjbQ [Candidatus Omnitrophica bacterium]|nr:secondary thiamine-phosphate synthase enzyme YjbQ [Candidatus Omnitrophota bacterium]MBU1925477.1 secondary thiamine-phosphate synthase enzyme YjbQ [Candidatus Omnitrophota bacterium]MBU2063247.1 secondary thiamine-phosphate synthase enzyme YjbQ [Candidatus Omnitrophota bacterium]
MIQIVTKYLKLKTKGCGDLVDITSDIRNILSNLGFKAGLVNVFVVGSTAAITSFEYEPGLVKDMRNIYEKIAPRDNKYCHDETWNDANGFSHVRAALQGAALTIPFEDACLLLGTWQQVVLAEFDTRARDRKVVLTFIAE